MAKGDKKAEQEDEPAKTTSEDSAESEETEKATEDGDAADEPEKAGESKSAEGDDDGDDSAEDAAEEKAEEEPAEEEPVRVRKPRTRNVQQVAGPPPPAGMGKSVFVFIGIFGALAVGFFVLGNSEPFGGSGNKPKWKQGQEVSVDLTLDPRDDTKLACAAKAEVAGRHCEFDDKTTKFAGKLEDPTQLRPYTATDGTQLLAAGVWTQPELEKAKRPTDRFTVRCKYKVEGFVKNPAVRWDPAGGWFDQPREWHAGLVSDCKVQRN
jgi:hypothetical protein